MSSKHRSGWLLFVVSSVLFLVAGARARDPWTVAGAIVFGIACLFFLAAPPPTE